MTQVAKVFQLNRQGFNPTPRHATITYTTITSTGAALRRSGCASLR